jgi:DNA transformation protein
MFGKTGVFCDGFMLGMVRDNTLYFRVDDDNRATFQEAESLPPLNYEKKGGTIDLSFWRAPERLFDEPDEFVTWGRAALAAARCLFSTGTHAAGGTAGHRWDSSRKLGFAPDSPLEEAVSSELVSEMLTGLGGN